MQHSADLLPPTTGPRMSCFFHHGLRMKRDSSLWVWNDVLWVSSLASNPSAPPWRCTAQVLPYAICGCTASSWTKAVIQGQLRVNSQTTLAKWKMRNEQGKLSGPVAQFPKLTFQFKTNNNALCLAWMSAAAKGRRYLLFLCQWKSSFIFFYEAHTVWGQPVSLGYTAQACLGGWLGLPGAFTKTRNYAHTLPLHTNSCHALHVADGS